MEHGGPEIAKSNGTALIPASCVCGSIANCSLNARTAGRPRAAAMKIGNHRLSGKYQKKSHTLPKKNAFYQKNQRYQKNPKPYQKAPNSLPKNPRVLAIFKFTKKKKAQIFPKTPNITKKSPSQKNPKLYQKTPQTLPNPQNLTKKNLPTLPNKNPKSLVGDGGFSGMVRGVLH